MSEDTLGPNGGVLYALEEVENNIEWLTDGLKGLGGISFFSFDAGGRTTGEGKGICKLNDTWINADDYVLFDCPGQVELFTHHSALRNIFFQIEKLGYRVCFSPSFPLLLLDLEAAAMLTADTAGSNTPRRLI